MIKIKTFLLPTDFSSASTHAVGYAYNLATQIKANIVLCNAVLLPAESPQVGLSVWPPEESDILLQDSADKLKDLASGMGNVEKKDAFKPGIKCINRSGSVYQAIQEIIANEPIDLVAIGTHETGMWDTLLLGDEARSLIDDATRPLLLVPPSAAIAPVKTIAFATDFKDLKRDMDCIYSLLSLARPLKAEILLTHVYDGESQSAESKQTIANMIKELCEKGDYPHIYFRSFENSSVESGLEWLCQHSLVNILAMVHRSHNFIDSLFRGSQTQKMAGHLPIPLLVFPE
jgi:nucleotide-binding universal stress UspA family protein